MEEKIQEIRDILDEMDELTDVDDSRVIKNVDNFIWKLSIDNYELSEKIKPFIEEYLKYYND